MGKRSVSSTGKSPARRIAQTPAAKQPASQASLAQPPQATQPAESQTVDITHEMIAQKAYDIWRSQGGSDLDNWLRAERELRTDNTGVSMR